MVATAALTGQVVDMESASGVQIAGAFGGGLQTGGKAVVNGTASAAVNTLTLGMVDKNIEVITVTAEDRAIGYDAAAGSAKFGATVLISTLGPGAVTNVAKGFGGAQAVCTTGKVLAGLDAVHNSVDVGKGVADIRENGFTVSNVLQVGGGALGLVGNVSTIKNTSCFAPGTPLLTPDGSKFIEDIRVGDLVLSRDEDDPEGPFVAKRVANLFQNYSPLVDLHVGGRVIRTTPEHPFWVVGRGWVAAQQIEVGDSLLGAVCERTVVESIEGSTESTVVYNLAIEEYHTYLVGATLWGFSVWVHNANYPDAPTTDAIRAQPGVAQGGKGLPDISGQWLNNGAGPIPGQIARQLQGRLFSSFRQFRQQFWTLVEQDPNLGPQFSDANRALMRQGRAPVAPSALQTGRGAANRTFNLDHIDGLGEQLNPSQAADLLYDLDNLQVLAPFWNQAR